VTKKVKNVAASVHALLLLKARAEGRSFNELLPYYGMERFLYRLSRTPHGKRFVLKGALALEAMEGQSPRATKDIDLLSRRSAGIPELVAMVRESMNVEVEDDGIRFDPRSVAGEPIRAATQYGGIRLTFRGALGTARLALQVDVGFGDAITPGPVELTYPTLLGAANPRLLGYPLETMIAEKLHAMTVLDMANSRMKDFFDLWTIAVRHELSGELVAQAVSATFERRATPLPDSPPIALTEAFYESPAKQTQWVAFLRKSRVSSAPSELAGVARKLRELFLPVLDALSREVPFRREWGPGGPWRAKRRPR
jgi:hypothetical protein